MEVKVFSMFYFKWWTWLWIDNFLLPGPQKPSSHLWEISKEPQSNIIAQETEAERRKASFSVPLGSQVKVTDTPQEASVTLTLGTSGDSACSCQCKKNLFSRAQIYCIKNEGWWREQMRKEPLIWWNTQYLGALQRQQMTTTLSYCSEISGDPWGRANLSCLFIALKQPSPLVASWVCLRKSVAVGSWSSAQHPNTPDRVKKQKEKTLLLKQRRAIHTGGWYLFWREEGGLWSSKAKGH